MRTIRSRYEDPLDRLWITCAERTGLEVRRAPGAYAHSDGRGTLFIATPEELDPDDCLAQMIFHELCHWVVEGEEAVKEIDWGLDNETDRDLMREHACIRLQAFLVRPRGLGTFFAPTTDFRLFYDALGPDPFVRNADEAPYADEEGAAFSIRLGKQALARIGQSPWGPHLLEALDATAAIAALLAPFAKGQSAEAGPLPSLYTRVEPPTPRHPAGFFLARPGTAAAHRTCGDCGFFVRGARAGRCGKSQRRTSADAPACERFEEPPGCASCGACCREAFDVVEVRPREAFARGHRHLLVERPDGGFELPRHAGRCPPLVGDGSPERPYRCSLYEERPRSCRDFQVGGEACLWARRRVGLST